MKLIWQLFHWLTDRHEDRPAYHPFDHDLYDEYPRRRDPRLF